MASNENELTIELKLDGSTSIAGDKGSKETKGGSYIQGFRVDTKVGMPAFFEVKLSMTEFKDIVLLDKLKPGSEVELKVGYDEPAVIFKGEISYIEPSFAAGENFVTISGYDALHRLTRGTSSRTFGDGHAVDQNFGSILGSLVGDSKTGKGEKSDGLSASAGSTDSKASYIAQFNLSVFDMIQRVANNFGLDWSGKAGDSKKINLKPLEKGSKALVICRDKYNPDSEVQAVSADFRVSTVKQVSKVIVRGWDGPNKKAIKGEAESVDLVIGGTPGYEQAGKAHAGSSSSGRVLEVVDIPVMSVGEAKEVAKSIMAKLSMDWMAATILIEGNPIVHAGVIVEVKDFGTRYSGEYIVEGCQHVFNAGSGNMFRTYLNLVRNGSPEP